MTFNEGFKLNKIENCSLLTATKVEISAEVDPLPLLEYNWNILTEQGARLPMLRFPGCRLKFPGCLLTLLGPKTRQERVHLLRS